MRSDYSAFTGRFRSLTDGEKRRETAARIGVTPSYVTGLRQGTHRPSRRLLETIVRSYGLDRAGWFALAGYEGQAAPAPEGTDPDARNQFADGIILLAAIYGDDLELKHTDLPAQSETPQQVRDRLVALARRAQEKRDRRRGIRGGAKKPPRLQRQAA